MSYENLSDDTPLAVAPKAEKSAVAIRNNIAQVESSIAEFDRINAGLADLAERFPVDLVYDVTTTKGMADAIAHRAAWRDPRISVEKYRKTAKAPVLALGKDIDARAAWLTEQLLLGETPVDEQIKAEERRKEEVKQVRIQAEFGRITAIQEAIAEISMQAMATHLPSVAIAARIELMKAEELSPAVFQEMIEQAKAAQRSAIDKLELTLKAKQHEEAEAAKLAAERAELEQLRAQAAEQKKKDEAAAAEARKTEDARLAAERAAAAAEQKRLDAEAAAARAEADRIAAEARREAQAKHEAEMAEQRKAVEAARQAEADKRAKAEAKCLKAEAADKMVRDAAPTMLAALREVRPFVTDTEGLTIIDAAIKEATGAA